MKKLFSLAFLLAFLFSFSIKSNAQNRTVTNDTQFSIYGLAADTLDNTEVKNYVIYVSPFASQVIIYAKGTSLSGGDSTRHVLQASFDNSNWVGLDSVITTTAIPVAFGTLKTVYMPYIRVHSYGLKTHKVIPKVFITIKK